MSDKDLVTLRTLLEKLTYPASFVLLQRQGAYMTDTVAWDLQTEGILHQKPTD